MGNIDAGAFDVCIGLACLGLGLVAGVATRAIYLLLSLP